MLSDRSAAFNQSLGVEPEQALQMRRTKSQPGGSFEMYWFFVAQLPPHVPDVES